MELLGISPVEMQAAAAAVGIYAIMAVSLNMMCGMTGLLQLGHAGFFGIGAYAAGLVSIYATFPELGFGNLFIGIAAAMACGALASLAVGIPCLRLRGDYLAIATLGFGEIARLTLANCGFPGGRMFPGESIGGPTGIAFTEFPADVWPKYPDYSAGYSSWLVIWIFAIAVWLLLLNVKRSAFGRAMMCVREDEIAAQSVGVNVARYKILSFVLSASFAGLAGALFFHKDLRVSPGNCSMLDSIEVLLMVVLGGLGSLTGSLFGAVILGLTPFVLRHLQMGEYKQLIYSVLLVLVVRLIPDGLFGMGETPPWLPRLFGRKAASEMEGSAK